jgi:CHAT domain-containing protein
LDNGSALRAALFDRLSPVLRGCTRLLLAPDGALNRLPFEVLPTDDGRYLIDDYRISYLSTGRDVLRFGAASTGQPSAPLVVADPDFDLEAAGEVETHPAPAFARAAASRGRRSRDLDAGLFPVERLPGTRVEGERIAAMLGVQPWLEGAVLETRLKTCRSPRILHLATHGVFLADQQHAPGDAWEGGRGGVWEAGSGANRLVGQGMENPLLRSFLILAGVNTWHRGGTLPAEAEDGILTAEDVSGLDLLATELVVLSACDTGLGLSIPARVSLACVAPLCWRVPRRW